MSALCSFLLIAGSISTIYAETKYAMPEVLRSKAFVPPRSRQLWEDTSIPLPTSVHELGQLRVRHHEHERKLDALGSQLHPLYPGYGTHFAYIYVGTPPQRQSVIIDTGSHYTAFPCTGCSQCGQHTDPYWDMKNSSTATVPQCNHNPCVISQTYSEGSSWKAFKVVDKLWVGGLTPTIIKNAPSYSINFEFGCQTAETGLFRTQLADGIMGLSLSDDTLTPQLVKNGITTAKIFALCFRIGGGILTIGGVDQRIHTKPGIQYARLMKTSGWYTLHLLDIMLAPQTGTPQSLGFPVAKYNEGKGCIVDSGTTDTYLPAALMSKFTEIFKKISGIQFSTGNIQLSAEQLAKMPNIVFNFEGTDGKPFEVAMPWTSYVDSVGNGKYAFRIYLTESTGTVLGANFMNGMNMIFDQDALRLGFARSNCKYEDFEDAQTNKPTHAPTHRPNAPPTSDGGCETQIYPLDKCTASCDRTDGTYVAVGNQTFADRCGKSGPLTGSKYCHVPCNAKKTVRGNPACPERAWTECNKACLQTRVVPRPSRRLLQGSHVEVQPAALMTSSNSSRRLDSCSTTTQTRTCYTGACPINDGDYLIFIDLRVLISPQQWSYVYSEAFFSALAIMYKDQKVKESAIELLNDASSEFTMGVKLHFQMRIKAKDFDSVMDLHDAAQSIPESVWSPDFKGDLVDALEEASQRNDHIDYSRFGWLKAIDIEVLNAMALPLGEVRDPVEIPDAGEGDNVIYKHITKWGISQLDLFLLGVALAAVLVLCCVLCMYYKLKSEHEALEKEKTGGGSLHKMWSKISGQGKNSRGKYMAIQMTDLEGEDNKAQSGGRSGESAPFSAVDDTDLDVEDLQGGTRA